MIRRARRREAGFSLIELMLVIAIMGTLATITVVYVIPRMQKANQVAAHAQIKAFESCLDQFHLDCKKFPDSLDALINDPGDKGWAGPYVKDAAIPKDPWGNDYVYTVTSGGKKYELHSYGGDGSPGGSGVDADVDRGGVAE
ncbi:MAG: type II secretion system major pseudopilin GspG [Planctomycetes bacterium]|nr:type II secretion system major pseudopilin GspG [Planctomycetota bacterium]